jgi:hypothetical protein
MSQARSGELKAERGRQGPNANQARRDGGNAVGGSVTACCHRSSPRRSMRRQPDPDAFGWPPDRGPYSNTTNRRTMRDRCPRVEPQQNSDVPSRLARPDQGPRRRPGNEPAVIECWPWPTPRNG